VSNEHLAALVRDAGAHATLVPDVPIVFDDVEPFPRPDNFTVALVCSFDADEPVAAMLDAAAQLPHMRFFMTGSPRHFPPALRERVPSNLSLTGFLSTPAYGGLLCGADVVLSLTTLDHTMLRSAYEAIYQGTPVIVSDSALLRQEFAEGAVHVDNTAPAIVDAIRAVERDGTAFRAGAMRLRQRKLDRWYATRSAILARLNIEE
jgi:glycosyltransferase involved in cell wall biosynthesis